MENEDNVPPPPEMSEPAAPQTQAATEPAAPQAAAPTQQGNYSPPPKKPPMQGLVSNKTMPVILTVGLVLVVLGAILVHAAPFITEYGSDTPTATVNGVEGPDQEQIDDDTAAKNKMQYTGNILNDIGMFLIVALLFLAAMLRTDLSETVRFGLLFAVGLILLGQGI